MVIDRTHVIQSNNGCLRAGEPEKARAAPWGWVTLQSQSSAGGLEDSTWRILRSLKKLMSERRTHTETPRQGSAVEAFPSDLLQQCQH